MKSQESAADLTLIYSGIWTPANLHHDYAPPAPTSEQTNFGFVIDHTLVNLGIGLPIINGGLKYCFVCGCNCATISSDSTDTV